MKYAHQFLVTTVSLIAIVPLLTCHRLLSGGVKEYPITGG